MVTPVSAVSFDPAVRADTARLTWLLNFQEHVDARVDDQAWIASPRPPRGWKRDIWAAPRPAGCQPWPAFEPRGIPNLGHEVVPYSRVLSTLAGRNSRGWEAWANVSLGLREEQAGLAWTPAPANATPSFCKPSANAPQR